jgi:hypothetical protein
VVEPGTELEREATEFEPIDFDFEVDVEVALLIGVDIERLFDCSSIVNEGNNDDKYVDCSWL